MLKIDSEPPDARDALCTSGAMITKGLACRKGSKFVRSAESLREVVRPVGMRGEASGSGGRLLYRDYLYLAVT